jgi:hypothetical protein
VALAHAADTSCDVLLAEAARLREAADALERQAVEVKRVREQYLGPRAAAGARARPTLPPAARAHDGAAGAPAPKPQPRARRGRAASTSGRSRTGR